MKSLIESIASLRYRVSRADVKAIYLCAVIDITLVTLVVAVVTYICL